jgi:hypothetical protein
MPLQIQNQQLYEDRTVQNWHRTVFPPNHDAIDIDLMGSCHRCREPLYLIESTTNPNKAYTILRKLAIRARIPALVIYHDTHVVIRGLVIHPLRQELSDADAVATLCSQVRSFHEQECR